MIAELEQRENELDRSLTTLEARQSDLDALDTQLHNKQTELLEMQKKRFLSEERH